MPDLSNKGSHEFWRVYPDPSIHQIISLMEGVEEWTLDDNSEIEESLAKFGAVLENIGNVDLQEEDKFIQISSYIKVVL